MKAALARAPVKEAVAVLQEQLSPPLLVREACRAMETRSVASSLLPEETAVVTMHAQPSAVAVLTAAETRSTARGRAQHWPLAAARCHSS